MSLFHYTDVNAVLSILKNCELWLTDIRFLNDSEEAIDGAKYIKKAIKSLSKTNDKHLNKAITTLDDFSIEEVLTDFNDMHMFVASFSRTGDSLTQWRSYGLYAIEFDEDIISRLAKFENCIYNHNKKVSYATALVSKTQAQMADIFRKEKPINHLDAYQMIWDLGDAVSLFKHESFQEENEARLISLESSLSDNINYRAKGDIILPYRKVKFPLRAIKAIHIGPMKHQDLAIVSLTSFTKNIDTRDQGENYKGIHRVEIIPSIIPYRVL